MKKSYRCLSIVLPLFLLIMHCQLVSAQQLPDTSQFFTIEKVAYPKGEGPWVFVDAAHNNFHTLAGRYVAFGNVLSADGYQLKDQEEVISPEVLSACKVYVIANPLHESNVGNWTNPCPSAFTKAEITALQQWVEAGGSLFLIADHMPFGGAAKDLAAAFGIEWLNCFAMDNRRRNVECFTHANGSLGKVTLTEGLDSVVTFTGSAFRAPDHAEIIIPLDEEYTLLSPEIAWQFTDDTPALSGDGWQQIAYFSFGKGRVAISGEAAMFSAQLAGPNKRKMGMNNDAARENVQLLRKLVGWLAD